MADKKKADTIAHVDEPEPFRLRHFLDGHPEHHKLLLLGLRKEDGTPVYTLDSLGNPDEFAAALAGAMKERI